MTTYTTLWSNTDCYVSTTNATLWPDTACILFGWFPSNASLASVLGDIASSGMGTLGISWESCPALTEVEEVVCDWLRQLTGLSDNWHGTIHDTASTAGVTAMILAREQASDISKNRGGLQSVQNPLVVYSTAQAHSSVAKAVQ